MQQASIVHLWETYSDLLSTPTAVWYGAGLLADVLNFSIANRPHRSLWQE